MADVLVRGLASETVRALDAAARTAGLPRGEYLRRHLEELAREAQGGGVTASDLENFAVLASDLANDQVMTAAWQ